MGLIGWLQLNDLREQQEQTNELLDQIRRQGLSQAERNKEDADRAKKAKQDWKSRWGLCFLS
jgi:hypothetical protein